MIDEGLLGIWGYFVQICGTHGQNPLYEGLGQIRWRKVQRFSKNSQFNLRTNQCLSSTDYPSKSKALSQLHRFRQKKVDYLLKNYQPKQLEIAQYYSDLVFKKCRRKQLLLSNSHVLLHLPATCTDSETQA